MTAKELKKLNRTKLLKLLLEVQKENESLREEVDALKAQLEDKQIAIRSAGSIAEASLKLSGIFDAAQKAADLYLQNVAPQAADQPRAPRILRSEEEE